ncbi:MAG: nucleotidyltransferase substrate binding protein [Prevotella sp.]|nr:nucleotidyltransferase substrate binding protein [Prevotella sp.]
MEKQSDNKADVRWLQRFSNYRKALRKLGQAVDIVSEKMDWGEEVDDLLQEGLIQRFEYTHELAWKVMKDYAEYQGYTDVKGSRDAFRKGLEMGIIDSGTWMESIEDRNQTSHNYDDETANEIYEAVVEEYYPLFKKFEKEMLKLSGLEPELF